MKKEEEILSRITGYSIQELHERLTEPILQPYDCLMAMVEFAEQQVKNLNIPAVIKSVCDDCTAYPFDERGKTPLCKTCKKNPSQTIL